MTSRHIMNKSLEKLSSSKPGSVAWRSAEMSFYNAFDALININNGLTQEEATRVVGEYDNGFIKSSDEGKWHGSLCPWR